MVTSIRFMTVKNTEEEISLLKYLDKYTIMEMMCLRG